MITMALHHYSIYKSINITISINEYINQLTICSVIHAATLSVVCGLWSMVYGLCAVKVNGGLVVIKHVPGESMEMLCNNGVIQHVPGESMEMLCNTDVMG